ncbi:MAG: ATP-dependent helicase [Bacteroidetes bacterium]|nr:ATP-dependent helicase [Bacteroidota bacterium]
MTDNVAPTPIPLSTPVARIVESDARRLRIVAGPGTGKSYALKRRVSRLLEKGQPAERILAVTFTRTAAADLVSDLHALNAPDCEQIKVCTLHAFCFSLLNRQGVLPHSGRVLRPLMVFTKSGSLQFEGAAMLSDLIKQGNFGHKRACTKRIRAFEAAWARRPSESPGWADNPIDQSFHRELISWLEFHRSILIGELVPLTLDFLRHNPTCDALRAFDHVLVDEYQDLNLAEQALVEYLSGLGDSVIVGDPNQSIYGFKYAHPEGISLYHEVHRNVTDETLAECRRCPTLVVELANSLIKENRYVDRHLLLQPRSANRRGKVHIVQWCNQEKEAQGIASFVTHLVRKEGVPKRDILILCPYRQMGYRIRDLIRDMGISVHSFYHEEALEEKAAQRSLALLTLLHDRKDRVALRWWLGSESSTDHLARSYARLRSYCEENDDAPFDALERIDQGDVTVAYVGSLVKRYRNLRDQLAQLSELPVGQLVADLFPEDEPTLSVLGELARQGAAEARDVGDIFRYVSEKIRHPEAPAGEFARVMSLHKSKGLTSRVVVVSGCAEGLIPFQSPASDVQSKREQLEEQRRLFYVAITRTTERLILSSFMEIPYGEARRSGIQVKSAGRMGRTIATRFLRELGSSAPRAVEGAVWQARGYTG